MPDMRVTVYEFSEKDHLHGVSVKGSAYDFCVQFGLIHQGKARPVIAVVRRAGTPAKLLPAGDYTASMVLEDRKGVLVATFDDFRPMVAAAPAARQG